MFKLQQGIRHKKNSPDQVAYEMQKNIMVPLGYTRVEAIELGPVKGQWNEAAVHWFKDKKDSML